MFERTRMPTTRMTRLDDNMGEGEEQEKMSVMMMKLADVPWIRTRKTSLRRRERGKRGRAAK